MSDDTPSLENGLSSQPLLSQYERWSEDSYVDSPHVRYQNDLNKNRVLGKDHPTAFREYSTNQIRNFDNTGHNGLMSYNNIGGPVHPAPTDNSTPLQTDLSPTMAGQNSLTLQGTSNDSFLPGSHIYQPFGDAGRAYFLDSDLETIEEESSVIESDFDDRSSIGYNRKRLPSDIHIRNRSSSTGSAQSISYRGSVTSTTTVSDDERSSSTLSSTPTSPNQRSSLSSDRSTPNNEQYENGINTNLRNGVAGHRRNKGTTHGYEIGGIDPNAQQKIVYAKCLSPPEQPKRHHHRTPAAKTLDPQFAATMNGHHSTPKTKSHHDQQSRKQSHLSPRNRKSQDLTITDMFEAVRKGDVQTLNKFSPTEQSETVDEKGNTVLHAAATSGHLQCVTVLATGSCSHAVSLLNDDLMTPAALSVKHGHLCCVQWLVQNTEAKEELIVSSRQASIDGSNMRPPLAHVASRYNQDAVLDWLCEEMTKEKYPVDSADHHSNTAVHEAAARGHLKCLQTLVGRGASVTVLNSHGDTPGQVADKNKHDLCVGYLVVVETCMSLAQQLITIKLENEGVRNENSNLRMQLQTMHNAKIQQAKESVEERIKATLQNLSSYDEDNEVHPVQPIEKKGITHTHPRTPTVPQQRTTPIVNQSHTLEIPSPEKNATKSDVLKMGSNILDKPNTHHQITKETPYNKSEADKNNSKNAPQTVTSPNATIGTNAFKAEQSHRPVATNYKETAINDPVHATTKNQVHNVTENGNTDVVVNAEVQNLMNGTSRVANAKSSPHSVESPNAKAWEKMAMDEVIRMARDTRYLPSPTVSMCTEDSTMETREAMRERLTDASRWFLGQQSGRKPHIKDPLFPTHKMRQSSPSQALPKSPQKSLGNTASWVLGVQKNRKGLSQHGGGSMAQQNKVPQNFVEATNQEFMKLQTEQNYSLARNQGYINNPGSIYPVAELSGKGSPVPSISSSSSSCLTERRNHIIHNSRPTSAKSTCSTTSTIRSNFPDSSSSSVSNSTTASQDTVVENGQDPRRYQYRVDPLEKRNVPSSPGSNMSYSSSRIHNSTRIDVKPTNDLSYTRSGASIHHGDGLSANETAELRVTLPTRNNSFLRKVQPAANHEASINNTLQIPSVNSPVSYPEIPSKQSPTAKLSSNMFSPVTSPTSPVKQSVSAGIQYSPEISTQKVEIVSPDLSNGSAVPILDKSREKTTSGKSGYVLWKPSIKTTSKNDELGADPHPLPTVEQPLAEKKKKTKQSKQPYGGLFSSNSPKTGSRRKMTKLFQF
ncbi:uncharacterized protein LOC120337671 [Styela clava]